MNNNRIYDYRYYIMLKHVTTDVLRIGRQFVDSFLDAMQQTGSDFTNCFRCLSRLSLPGCTDHAQSRAEALNYILTQCSTLEELRAACAPKMDPRW